MCRGFFFSETPLGDRHELFVKKVRQCRRLFDFQNVLVDLREKEIKRACLTELIEYVTHGRGIITEPIYAEIIGMVNFTFYDVERQWNY